MQQTFGFVIGWVLMITLLTFINKSRLGHVIIYYTLLLMIVTILLAEAQVYAPLIGNLGTLSQINNAAVTPTPPKKGHGQTTAG